MSWCRFGEGDVYLYQSLSSYVCCMCSLPEVDLMFETQDLEEYITHIGVHRKNGEYIPSDVEDRIRQDVKERPIDFQVKDK